MERFGWISTRQKLSLFAPVRLEEASQLPCPVCRSGQIAPITLMDIFGCGSCRRFFEPDLQQQTIRVVDGSQSVTWRWLGQRWQPTYQIRAALPSIVWLGCALLIVGPAGLIALSAYIFPPLEDSRGASFSVIWSISTLISHSLLVSWLISEYYQLSWYALLRVWLQRLLERPSP